MQTIRASEIGEYVYCARAWWLRRVAGEQPEGAARRAAGVRRHARHGLAVALSRLALWAGLLALAAGLLLLAFMRG
jgi:CRISPR/Cas system-associated exonuclease Cas4 (RecB family)